MKISIDKRLKSKIEELSDFSNGDNVCYSVRFKDVDDAFFFGSDAELYDFMNQQITERFYDKELRRGYFDYINDNGDTLRYNVKVSRGTFTSVKDECLGTISK